MKTTIVLAGSLRSKRPRNLDKLANKNMWTVTETEIRSSVYGRKYSI